MYQDHQASFAVSPPASAALLRVETPLPGMAPLRVGLLGLGTVGAGTYQVLQRNADLIAARTGRRIDIAMVAVRNLARAGAIVGDEVTLVDDPFQVVNHPDIDVVVEVIGGTTLARELVLQLGAEDFGPDFPEALGRLLGGGRAREGCAVRVVYSAPEARAEISLGAEWRLSPSDEALARLRERFGPERVRLRYA